MPVVSSYTPILGADLADSDDFLVIDVSDSTQAVTGTTKRITKSELGSAMGGSSSTTVYSKDFAYNTPNLNDGITLFTPAVGDVLLDAWFVVTEAFNGTTPQADIGTFDGATTGLFRLDGNGAYLDTAGDEPYGAGMLVVEGAYLSLSVIGVGPFHVAWQVKFTATTPLKLVASQDGSAGGTAVGGTTGAATLYVVVATPVAL